MTELFSFTDISVIHVYQWTKQPYQIYCGRANPRYKFKESPLHNPKHIGDDGRSRDQACDDFENYFIERVEAFDIPIMTELVRLIDIKRKYGKLELMCWCMPKRCHCQTIQRYLINLDNNDQTNSE